MAFRNVLYMSHYMEGIRKYGHAFAVKIIKEHIAVNAIDGSGIDLKVRQTME